MCGICCGWGVMICIAVCARSECVAVEADGKRHAAAASDKHSEEDDISEYGLELV